jgi:hypothetical protein
MLFGAAIGTLSGCLTAILQTRSTKFERLSVWALLWRLSASKFVALGMGRFIVIGQMLRQLGNCRAVLRMCTAMSFQRNY